MEQIKARVPAGYLTKEQADLLHRAVDAAQKRGACTYRMKKDHKEVPCCVIAQADALSGGESWKSAPNNPIYYLRECRPELFATLRGYPLEVLEDLQFMWDRSAYEASEGEVRRAMHGFIDRWTVGR